MFGKKNKHPAAPVARPAAPAKPVTRTEAPAKPASSTAAPPSQRTGTPAQAIGKGEGKLAYEARRAEKAGMGLEKWMAEKERRARTEREAIAQTKRKSESGRQNQAAKPGLLRRLLDRAHRPI